MKIERPRYVGVYLIVNLINFKVYVGSAVNIKKRCAAHRNYLRRGVHGNAHLQASWNKHGADKFTFVMFEFCEKEVLLNRETHWVNFYKSLTYEHGYNCVLPNDLKVIRPATNKSNLSLTKYYCLNFETKEILRMDIKEIRASLQIESNNVSRAVRYWREVKGSRKKIKGWGFIHPKDFKEEFDYFSYDRRKEYWNTYISRAKKYEKKSPEDIIPYSKRRINRIPLILIPIDGSQSVTISSLSEACALYKLSETKIRKCLNAPYGKYKHKGFFFKRQLP